MNMTLRFLLITAVVTIFSGVFTGCESADHGSNPGAAGYYPPGYYAPDVVTPVPRPETPVLKPEHPIAVPPPAVVRPMPPMAPMPRPALRR